jgi:glutaminyl-peptide cyclotransferase
MRNLEVRESGTTRADQDLRSSRQGWRRNKKSSRNGYGLPFLLSLLATLAVVVSCFRPEELPRLNTRDYARLESISPISTLLDPSTTVDHRQPNSILSKILIPRIPGSKNNLQVQRILSEPFQGPNSKWNVTRHTFTANTPIGNVEMTNIIISRHPNALRQLVLAAHHDSKVSPKDFIGATDSAVPCAIIADTALALEALMEDARGNERWDETGLQLIFFDGEEAYNAWTRTDSTYGSRALASHWVKQYHRHSFEPLEARRLVPGLSTMRQIDSIEHFVLLDLLGTPHPRIPSYYPQTAWMHDELRSVEKRLAQAGLLFPKKSGSDDQYDYPPGHKSYNTDVLPMPNGVSEEQHSFFTNDGRTMFGIEDDHLPFLANGVPICHLIPSPFPSVWHTRSDDASAIDYPTVYAWTMIMRLFVAEYLGLRPKDDSTPSNKRIHIDLVSVTNFNCTVPVLIRSPALISSKFHQ